MKKCVKTFILWFSELKFYEQAHLPHLSCVIIICHVSCVMYQLPCVACHVSHVICHMSYFLIFLYRKKRSNKWVEGPLLTGLSRLVYIYIITLVFKIVWQQYNFHVPSQYKKYATKLEVFHIFFISQRNNDVHRKIFAANCLKS